MGGGAIRVHTLSSSFLAYIQLYDRIGIMQDEISITKSKIRKRLVNAFGIKYARHPSHLFLEPTRIFSNGTGCSVRTHSPLNALISQSLSPAINVSHYSPTLFIHTCIGKQEEFIIRKGNTKTYDHKPPFSPHGNKYCDHYPEKP